MKNLKALAAMLKIRARQHATVGSKVKLELVTLIVREYSRGGSEGEKVGKHTDTVDEDTGKEDPRPVVSVVFVLKGGFSASGYDVRIFTEMRRRVTSPISKRVTCLRFKGGRAVCSRCWVSREPQS